MVKTKVILNTGIEIAVLLALFVLPFSKSIVEICIIAGMVLFAVKKLFYDKGLTLMLDRRVGIFLGLFVLANILSLVNTAYPLMSLKALVSKVLKWCVLFLIIADTMTSPRHARRMLMVMIASSVLILFDAYYQYLFSVDILHYPEYYRIFKGESRWITGVCYPTASFPYPADFAVWLNVIFFTFVGVSVLDLARERYLKSRLALCAGIAGIFLFLTNNRGAFIAAFLTMGIFVAVRLRRFAAIIVIALLALGFLTWRVPAVKTMLTSGVLDVRLSFADRTGMWKTGWRIFTEHPVIGNGVNTFFEKFKNARDDRDRGKFGSYAHNCYLQMAADIGLPGVLSFIAFVSAVIVTNLRRARSATGTMPHALVVGLAMGIVTFMVHACVDTNFYSLNLAALFWICLGYLEATGRSCRTITRT
ncbi:MAG: O-antigen ligase family protein [Candidatus Omnitrophica bacterium]|nr:O-antigen ligase family protein [Candidatus Omnitrophota bacterium]